MIKKARVKCQAHKGWSFFFTVLIFGLILAIFNLGVGISGTLRIPVTNLNFSLGGALGKKEVVPQVFPKYLRNQVADNTTFFNHSNVLTIWLAEGMGIVILGYQKDAPAFDINLKFLR